MFCEDLDKYAPELCLLWGKDVIMNNHGILKVGIADVLWLSRNDVAKKNRKNRENLVVFT